MFITQKIILQTSWFDVLGRVVLEKRGHLSVSPGSKFGFTVWKYGLLVALFTQSNGSEFCNAVSIMDDQGNWI